MIGAGAIIPGLSGGILAVSMGLYQPTIEAMMAESKYTGWIDKYTQLLKNTNTTKGGSDNEGGRPRENSTTLTPSGEASRDSLE